MTYLLTVAGAALALTVVAPTSRLILLTDSRTPEAGVMVGDMRGEGKSGGVGWFNAWLLVPDPCICLYWNRDSWRHFSLSLNQKKVMYWSWLYANYANWLGCLIGAIFGADRTTPLASDGLTGSWFAEAVVAFILVSVGLVSLIAAALSVWGLWGVDSNASQEMKE